MPNYWIKGTTSTKYAKSFVEMIELHNIKIGSKILVYINKNSHEYQVLYGDQIIFEKSGLSTLKQYLDVWRGMGLICSFVGNCEFIVSFVPNNYKQTIEFVKATSLNYINDKKIEEFRYSTLINVLYYSGVINWEEIIAKGIDTSKHNFDEKSITKSISSFEKEMAKDEGYLILAKRRYNEINQ